MVTADKMIFDIDYDMSDEEKISDKPTEQEIGSIANVIATRCSTKQSFEIDNV